MGILLHNIRILWYKSNMRCISIGHTVVKGAYEKHRTDTIVWQIQDFISAWRRCQQSGLSCRTCEIEDVSRSETYF